LVIILGKLKLYPYSGKIGVVLGKLKLYLYSGKSWNPLALFREMWNGFIWVFFKWKFLWC